MAVLIMIIYSIITFGITVFLLLLIKKKNEPEKKIFLYFRIASVLTLLIHYSDFIYRAITTGDFTPESNLIFIPYPCNLIMWLCIFLCFFEDSHSKMYEIISDFVAIGGTLCGVFGVIFNKNYFNNPNLLDYDIFKGLISHNTMVFATVLLLITKIVKIKPLKNTIHVAIGVILMVLCGLYCKWVDLYYGIEKMPYAMFITEAPFESMPFITFPVICGIALIVIYCSLWFIEKAQQKYDKD